ncbi:MAG TPA: hypothetical protein VGR35_17070 [Tepidisphaeraceae bacterium]|nr:hypothetical protein [Tepidisphaeraceae bacterium]
MTGGADEAGPKLTARTRSRRRWPLILAIILVPLLITYAFICNYLERKIENAIAQKLDAELRIRGLLYFPPYGIWLSGAHLVRGHNVILDLGRVDLKLAESPFGEGPIVIEHFDVTDPVVRIIRTEQGLQGGPGFVKEEVKEEPEPEKKFSDFLRLRQFKITNGQIIYDDDTTTYARDVTWRDVNVDIHTAQQGPSLYTYELTFGNGHIVDGSAAGSIDIDSLVLALDRTHMGVRVDPSDTESPLPSELQGLLKDYAVAGRLSIDGEGLVRFRELENSRYGGTIELADGKLRIPKWDAGFDDADITLRLATAQPDAAAAAAATQPTVPGLDVAIDSVRIASGRAVVSMSGGKIEIDPATRTWSLRELVGQFHATEAAPHHPGGEVGDAVDRLKLAGTVDITAAAEGPLKPDSNRRLQELIRHEVLLYPYGLAVQPKNWPEPLRAIGGVVRIVNGTVVAENLSARYGNDQWLLDGARMPLEGLPRHVLIYDLHGALNFRPPSVEYPKALRATVRALAPSGEFPVSGWMHFDLSKPPGERAQYDMMVSSDTAAFAVTPRRIPIMHIRGDAIVQRDGPIGTVDIRSFDGLTLGGMVSAKAKFITTEPRSYAGTASLRDINLDDLAMFFQKSEDEQPKRFGQGFANIELSGETRKETAWDSLRGRGRIEVIGGDFFQLPVLGAVTKLVTAERRHDISTIGEAALLLSVDGRTINVRKAAFSSPLLGMQGDGRVTVDGQLNVNLVAAPLADWRDKLKQTNIPIISDVTGELAGAIQRTLNAATRGLLYEFRVTGDLKQPQIATVPVPALSEARAILFGHMLGEPKDKRLIDSLNEQDAVEPN